MKSDPKGKRRGEAASNAKQGNPPSNQMRDSIHGYDPDKVKISIHDWPERGGWDGKGWGDEKDKKD